MASIAASISRIKQDALGALGPGAVEQVCDEIGHAWRDRELDPATTIALFVQQVVHGNVPCSEVRHLAGKSFTPSAYCQARARLPLAVVQSLLRRVCEAAMIATRQAKHLWLGRHRVFHIDGSTFSMPDTPGLCEVFGLPRGPKPGCGFPTAHLLVLFHAQTGSVTLTMVTTLVDPTAYPAGELLELRLRRWDVETNLRHLKITMNMDVLRCKSEQGVRKELAVFCLVYNLVRVVMLEAAWRQDVPVTRVSFADALKWTRHARPGDVLPDLIVNPRRPDRVEPRCKKRRPKQYALMNKPRDVLRKRPKKQRKKA